MAAKVFAEGKRITDLPGYCGISHLRYPTMGTSSAYVLFGRRLFPLLPSRDSLPCEAPRIY